LTWESRTTSKTRAAGRRRTSGGRGTSASCGRSTAGSSRITASGGLAASGRLCRARTRAVLVVVSVARLLAAANERGATVGVVTATTVRAISISLAALRLRAGRSADGEGAVALLDHVLIVVVALQSTDRAAASLLQLVDVVAHRGGLSTEADDRQPEGQNVSKPHDGGVELVSWIDLESNLWRCSSLT
jgi:hypothetical protein